jgi:hypothetical protein
MYLHLWHVSARSRRLYLASFLRSSRQGLSAQCPMCLTSQVPKAFLRAIFCPQYPVASRAPAQCSCQAAGAGRSRHRLSSFLLHMVNYGSRRHMVRLNSPHIQKPDTVQIFNSLGGIIGIRNRTRRGASSYNLLE